MHDEIMCWNCGTYYDVERMKECPECGKTRSQEREERMQEDEDYDDFDGLTIRSDDLIYW